VKTFSEINFAFIYTAFTLCCDGAWGGNQTTVR